MNFPFIGSKIAVIYLSVETKPCHDYTTVMVRLRFMVFNATFNNITVISWWSVLLVEETEVPERKPPTCRKSLTNCIT